MYMRGLCFEIDPVLMDEGYRLVEEGLRLWQEELAIEGVGEWGIARSLNWFAAREVEQNNYERAMQLLEDSLERFRKLGDLQGIARVGTNIALLDLYKGNHETAEQRFEESLTLFRKLQYKYGIVDILLEVGWLAYRKDERTRMRAVFIESWELSRQLGENRRIGWSLYGLAWSVLKEPNKAYSQLEQALRHFRDGGDTWGMARVHLALSKFAPGHKLDHLLQASGLLQERLRKERGAEKHLRLIALDLAALGVASEALGEPLRAATLLGAALAILSKMGLRMPPADWAEYGPALDRIRSTMEDELMYIRAVAAGMDLIGNGSATYVDKALAYALGEM